MVMNESKKTLLCLMCAVGAMVAGLTLTGCADQNWAQAGEDDPAPVAPDYVPGAEYEEGEADKHAGGTHTVAGQAGPVPGVTLLWDQCGNYPYTTACWWKHTEYGLRKVYTNYDWTTWTLDRIYYSWCMRPLGQLSPTHWIASQSALVCIHGKCVDVSNRSATSGSCRSGYLYYGDLPLVIGAQQSKHVDILVKLRQWDLPNPSTEVSMDVGPLRYWD
jgi:hypothetical protein